MRAAPSERFRWWQGVLLVLVVGLGAQVAGMVVAGIAMAVQHIVSGAPFGGLTFEVLAATVVATGMMMILGVVFAAPVFRVRVRSALGLRGAPWAAFVAAPIGILALGPTSDWLRRAMETHLPGWTWGTLPQIEEAVRNAPVWAAVPILAFMPGISEELLFRGAFQRSISRRDSRWPRGPRLPVLAVVLSGLVFACFHGDPHHVVGVLPLGFYLAWLGERTESVLVPMTAHIVNNGLAAVMATSGGPAETTPGLEWYWMPLGWGVAALAIAIVWWSTRRARVVDAIPIEELALEPVPVVEPSEPPL